MYKLCYLFETSIHDYLQEDNNFFLLDGVVIVIDSVLARFLLKQIAFPLAQSALFKP